MSILDMALKAFEDAEKKKKNRILERKRQERINQYWDTYWGCALVVWEIASANFTLLKVQSPKEPKWLLPTKHEIKSLNNYEYVLQRINTNSPSSDGAVLRHEVAQIIEQYLKRCNFTGITVVCTEDTYSYNVTITIPNAMMGRPMSSKIGRLSVRRLYDANNDIYYPAFAIQYFDGGSFVEIRDNININLYHTGQFFQTTTMRDTYGNVSLSRLPFKVRADYNYLVIV